MTLDAGYLLPAFVDHQNDKEICELRLYDMLGRVLISMRMEEEVKLDVTDLVPGAYVVAAVKNGLHLERKKLIVIH